MLDKMTGESFRFLIRLFYGEEWVMRQNLAEGRVGITLLKFAGPFLLASLLQALYGAADLFVVGQFADSAAVSGVSIGSQVMQTLTGVILGMSMGGTVLIGRKVGEGDDPGAAKAVGTVSALFAAAAAVLTPLMLLATDGAVTLLDTPAEAVEDTRQYLLICSCGIPFIIGYNAVGGIFRGLGDSRTPLYFVGLACVVNIALDFLLTGGMGWGAAGAAVATAAAQAVAFAAALLYLLRKGLPFALPKSGGSPWRPGREEAGSILKVGFPLALQDALVNISFLIITAIINAMGLVASAAVGVVEKLLVFAFLPLTAVSSAVAAMTAQNIGAGRRDRAMKVLRCGIAWSLLFAVLFCLYAQFFPATLTRLFTGEAPVIAAAADYLRSYSTDCILVAFVFCMNAYFSGCSQSVIPLIHSLIATFGVRIPLSFVLSRLPGESLYPIGFAAPAATALSLIICLSYLFWQRRRMPKDSLFSTNREG